MTKKNDQHHGVKFKKSEFTLREEEILGFWDRAKTFEKSVEKEAPNGDYVFYDGPPFGTGEPHYGHILSSVSKDVVPRYWTMKGYRVARRWGWDCHGLPIENIIEADMGISGKKEIEKIGIAKFNEACRSRVLEYADIWDVMVRRIARWVDFKNSYKTMDASYMESVWWGFKEAWKKDLIYQGRKVLMYCPRCETPISNFEVAMDNSYKDITEASVYAKFKVTSPPTPLLDKRGEIKGDIYILAWTTTPWTLPGNVALAVGSDITYAMIKVHNEFYIIAKDRLEIVEHKHELVKEFKGKELVGLEYEPLFDVSALKESGKKVYYVADADFVTTEDGTGVVHTAVVYGEDDYNLGLKLDLPVIPALDEKGHFNETVPQFKGMYFKKADKLIIEDLDKRGLLFKKEDYPHSYPFCHRCDTQLFYNAIPAWFLSIEKIRKDLVKQNENINWYPAHLKEGRFKLGIEQAPDWNISRNRYFATPMPIWECDKCEEREVVGSIAELEEKSGKKDIKDIHSHFIDDLTWQCSKCGDGNMHRISEVFDCWVESGSMSFAENHYMGKALPNFDPVKDKRFPAQYISEYISQTRAWFYVMHAMSVALFGKNSFENCVTNGVILNEKGEKMSKSKKNYPDPWKVINEFGVDALRFYMMSSSIMHAENLYFNERELRDVFRKNVMLLWNVFKFYNMFADESLEPGSGYPEPGSGHVLDKWIIARLNQLIGEVTNGMDNYDLPRASRPITDFIDDLSTWYVRRSRDRLKGDDQDDKDKALHTLGFVLLQLSKTIAPFMPFMAEEIWQKVTSMDYKDDNRSVHLEQWTVAGEVDDKILNEMEEVRKIVELGLAKRDEAAIKVRQPLAKLIIKCKNSKIENKEEYLELVKDEVNVKAVEFAQEGNDLSCDLDIELTDELKQEGIKREIVRSVNALRKQAKLTIADRIHLYWDTEDKFTRDAILAHAPGIMKDTLTKEIDDKKSENVETTKEVDVNGAKVWLGLIKT